MKSVLFSDDKYEWRSECCDAPALGELSTPWHELQGSGESKLMREGLCAGCNAIANFVKK